MASFFPASRPNLQTLQFEPAKSYRYEQPIFTKFQENAKTNPIVYKSYLKHISCLCKNEQLQEAVDFITKMEFENLRIGPDIYGELLQGCIYERDLFLGQQFHAKIIKLGEFFYKNEFIETKLLIFYSKCDHFNSSYYLFSRLRKQNAFSWAAIIGMYCRMDLSKEALLGFIKMQETDVLGDTFVVPNVLKACGSLKDFELGQCVHGYALKLVEEGKQAHAIAILYGLDLDKILGSSIINFYGKVGLLEDAELVFRRVIEKDVLTWNVLISSYVQHGLVDNALNLCHEMRQEGFVFTGVTLSSILSASADTRDLRLGKEGHCYCIRHNVESDAVVASSIIDMYAKCDRIHDARQVFESTEEKDLVLWNTMLAAFAEQGLSGEALKLFYSMQLESVPPNVVSWNSVILGFLRNGQVNEATDMFLEMLALNVQPNLITYTTLINGLSLNGLVDEAIMMFQTMLEAGLQPNIVSISSVLSACADTASLTYGRAVHGYTVRQNLPLSVSLATSLVDMYAKCGSLKDAKHVYDMVLTKELPLNNAMISAYALHGCPKDAIAVYKHLKEENSEPDGITFTNVLSSCSHSGLIIKGIEIFSDMITVYGVKPSMEHYGCIISLLSRQGNLGEVLELIQTMPFKADGHVWGSLLAACREVNETEVGERISEYLIRTEPRNAGNYVTVSNAYAAVGRWNEVSKLRNLMKERGIRKNPGSSWIQIGEEFFVFVSGDTSHSKTQEIYAMLSLLEMEMHFS
ncbi:hypothetical protein M9H77_01860 [Catharanthus roseus]|uniref:Uncharacterized protein n=1 Tax=Catharanthus roseus TaxID=4058 RepID=A0ACC0C6P5_CATRO|nr:hypothetical protein M9H77_01860 [Catharanthus roseus]